MALSFSSAPTQITSVTSAKEDAFRFVEALEARGGVDLDVVTKAREVYLLCHGQKEFRIVKERGKEMAVRLLDKKLTANGFVTEHVEAWLWVWFATASKEDAREVLARVEQALHRKLGYK